MLQLPDQVQQSFWGGEDAGEKAVPRRRALAFAGCRRGEHLYDPGAARPVGLYVLRCLLPLRGSLHAPVRRFDDGALPETHWS